MYAATISEKGGHEVERGQRGGLEGGKGGRNDVIIL